MPSLTTWAPFCAVVLPMWTMLSPWSKQSRGCSCQGCKATNHTGTLRNLPDPASGTTPTRAGTLRNPPEPSEPCLRNLHQHAPELSRTLRNLPRPSGTFRNLYPRNLRQHTLEPSEIFLNLPEPAPGTYTSIRRNPPEPEPASGTYTIHFTPELSGTLRNLPAPASGTRTCTSTRQNSPEPSSGTCSCDPRRHTPELFWSEDTISLRCWGKTLQR